MARFGTQAAPTKLNAMIQRSDIFAMLTMLMLAHGVFAQGAQNNPGDGEAEFMGGTCGRVWRAAEEVLRARGIKIAAAVHCGNGMTCITTGNTKPQLSDGTLLKRGEIVQKYLKKPLNADFRARALGRGYWEAPDHNFVMGGSLKLKDEAAGCTATLGMNFGMRFTQFLLFLPFESYGEAYPSNGLLETGYLAAIRRGVESAAAKALSLGQSSSAAVVVDDGVGDQPMRKPQLGVASCNSAAMMPCSRP